MPLVDRRVVGWSLDTWHRVAGFQSHLRTASVPDVNPDSYPFEGYVWFNVELEEQQRRDICGIVVSGPLEIFRSEYTPHVDASNYLSKVLIAVVDEGHSFVGSGPREMCELHRD